MMRWLAYIQLLNFHVKHISGSKNSATDTISRRSAGPADSSEDENNPDDYFDAKLYSVQASYWPVQRFTARIYLHDFEYDGDDLVLGCYLKTLWQPSDITDEEFQRLHKKSDFFLVRDGYLYKRSKKGHPPYPVVGKIEQQNKVILEVHNRYRHRGQQVTYDQLRR